MARGKGEGSIVQRRDGRWQGSVLRGGRRHYVYGRTAAEVRRKLRELIHRLDAGERVVTPELRDWAREWWEHTGRKGLRPRTIAAYEVTLRRAEPYWPRVALADLRPTHLRRMLAEMHADGVPPSRLRLLRVLLHRMLEDALREDLVTRNVAKGVRPPSWEPRRRLAITWEEVQRVLAAEAHDLRWYTLWTLLAWTGMRAGEVLALHWEDVDLQAGILRVRRNLVTPTGGRTGPPKTKAGYRSLALPREVCDLLARWREVCPKGVAVFPGRGATYMMYNTLRARWSRLREALGLRPELTVHSFRHGHATWLLEQGVHPRIVQHRLGHHTVQITLDTYTHVLPEVDAAEIARVASSLRSVVKSVVSHGALTHPSEGQAVHPGSKPSCEDVDWPVVSAAR